jgi:hypothetical protein
MNPDNDAQLAIVRTRGADRVLVDVVRNTPVEVALSRLRRRFLCGIILLIVVVAALFIVRRVTADKPKTYRSDAEHFLYGSIGSEPGGNPLAPVGGMLPPYQIFVVLPDMFPDRLPGGYASLGLVYETNRDGKPRDLPIGISRRQRLGLDLVGFNCAVCHVGTVRTSRDVAPRIVPGMPAHQLDLEGLFAFVLGSVLDPRFTPDNVIGHIEVRFGPMSEVDRLLTRLAVVPQLRERTLLLQAQVGVLFAPGSLEWGPGRVDTFNPYKSLQFGWKLEQLPRAELAGPSDFPSLWNQAPREGMHLHWDGNNTSLDERNLSAGLGAGITPATVDYAGVARVKDYIQKLPPPRWPETMPLDQEAAARGAGTYRSYCADCHDFGGKWTGQVEPWEKIGTDRSRLDSYTAVFSSNQNTLFAGTTNRFKSFHKTNGYANEPLDGIWARAPFLHNGSVPTLADLLEPPERRPKQFYRGCDVYDPVKVGFVSDVGEENGKKYFLYRTADEQGNPIAGNANSGHAGRDYGTDLSSGEKHDLIEFLKTL